MATAVRTDAMNRNYVALVVLALTCLAGCQTTQPLYNFGTYQSNLYQQFKNEDASVTEQIAALEKTIQQSAAKNLKVGPGIHAHLGYLYLESGQKDQGIASLQQEKALYPESAHFMDFLLNNAKARK
jgi:hypothetical protein